MRDAGAHNSLVPRCHMLLCMMTKDPAGSRNAFAPSTSSAGGVVENIWLPGMASEAAETTVWG